MIISTIITDRYQLEVDYNSPSDIDVIFTKNFGEDGEQRFEYEFSHYMDAIGKILQFNSYFDDAEFDRFYQTMIELFK